MKKEDKELLIKDLCARLPYGVKVQYENKIVEIDYISALYEEIKLDTLDNYTISLSEITPFLRPMSSMTEEERKEYYTFQYKFTLQTYDCQELNKETFLEYLDWLNKNHFDYRGLIEKDLAIEAPEGMYK